MSGTFPLTKNSNGFDSASYSVMQENPAIKTEMEGGYMTSRPRFTRTPRKTFTLAWKAMLNTDKIILDAFWNTNKGSSDSFIWRDPVLDVDFTVRFKGDNLNFKYVGLGATRLWDIQITLEQV